MRGLLPDQDGDGFGGHDDPVAEAISFDELVAALATFECTLTTPDAPFGRFIAGDKGGLESRRFETSR